MNSSDETQVMQTFGRRGKPVSSAALWRAVEMEGDYLRNHEMSREDLENVADNLARLAKCATPSFFDNEEAEYVEEQVLPSGVPIVKEVAVSSEPIPATMSEEPEQTIAPEQLAAPEQSVILELLIDDEQPKKPEQPISTEEPVVIEQPIAAGEPAALGQPEVPDEPAALDEPVAAEQANDSEAEAIEQPEAVRAVDEVEEPASIVRERKRMEIAQLVSNLKKEAADRSPSKERRNMADNAEAPRPSDLYDMLIGDAEEMQGKGHFEAAAALYAHIAEETLDGEHAAEARYGELCSYLGAGNLPKAREAAMSLSATSDRLAPFEAACVLWFISVTEGNVR